MAQAYIKQVMESMGWTDGNMIPVANEENRQILNAISELLKEKAEKCTLEEVAQSRVTNLSRHCKNSENSISQNVKLVNAHRSQLTTETHLSKVAERDDCKYLNLLKDLEKEHDDMKKFEDKTAMNINRMRKNIEKLSGKIDWAKQALTEWNQAMSKGDEANKLIERFCKQDQSSANKLENKRRTVQDAIVKHKKTLVDLYEEQKSLEQVLQRTAQLYRQAHLERRQLIQTWKDAVYQMAQRENDIDQSEKDLEEAIVYSKKNKTDLKEQEEFLKQQILNNKEVEKGIAELNEQASEVKKRQVNVTASNALKANEAQAIQKELGGLMQKLQQQRSQNQHLVNEKIRIYHAIHTVEKQVTNLESRHQRIQDENSTSAERLTELDGLLETEEKLKYQLAQEIDRLNNVFYRSQQQLGNLKSDEKILCSQNRGVEATLVSIRNSMKDDEKELARKIEQAYNMSFKVQQLEMKISKLQGGHEDVDPEKEARIASLENHKSRALTQLNMLQLQVKQVEDDMRKLTSNYNSDLHEMEKMAFVIKEKETVYDGGEKKLKEVTTSNQERLVELSVLRMRASQMEQQIAKHDNNLFNIEKHRMELERTVNERLINLKSQQDLLNMKRKHLQDERTTLKADIAERRIRIDAMKTRYNLAVDLLGKNDDGSLVTVTQLRIEAAQEKQMLLHEGNELNEKVLKAEKDVKAMENTLCLLNYSNDAYRKSFGQCDDDNPQLIKLNELKDQCCKTLTELRWDQSKLPVKEAELEEAVQKHESLERELEELNRNRMDNNDILIKVHKELTDQKLKLQRAERELKAAQKAARQRCNDLNYFCQFEHELDLRELEEKNTTALQLLADTVEMNSDLAPVVSTLFYEKGMKIPQVKRLQVSSSYRSEYSERTMRSISETSLQIFSGTSKTSYSSCSSQASTKATSKICRGSSAHPSVVSLEFPGALGQASKMCDSKSSGEPSRKFL